MQPGVHESGFHIRFTNHKRLFLLFQNCPQNAGQFEKFALAGFTDEKIDEHDAETISFLHAVDCVQIFGLYFCDPQSKPEPFQCVLHSAPEAPHDAHAPCPGNCPQHVAYPVQYTPITVPHSPGPLKVQLFESGAIASFTSGASGAHVSGASASAREVSTSPESGAPASLAPGSLPPSMKKMEVNPSALQPAIIGIAIKIAPRIMARPT